MSPGGSSAYDWGDTIDEENAALLSASITDEALQALAGTRDLENVRFLQMAVDSEFVPLSCLGDRLPALEQLKLNGSSLTSLRSLGTSMTKVRVLWLCRCGLKELDNLGALPELQELYLAFNDIEKLSPLTEADQLQVLDLEREPRALAQPGWSDAAKMASSARLCAGAKASPRNPKCST